MIICGNDNVYTPYGYPKWREWIVLCDQLGSDLSVYGLLANPLPGLQA